MEVEQKNKGRNDIALTYDGEEAIRRSGGRLFLRIDGKWIEIQKAI